MSDKTKIEWCNATWNPITGCSRVSPGCENCYAERLSGTRLKHHWSREGLTSPGPTRPLWNGKVRFNEQWLNQPLDWKRPRRIFVCAHSDLFHEHVPNRWIKRVFRIMREARQHLFQVLTKRPEIAMIWTKTILHGQDRGYGLKPPWPLLNVHLGVSVEDQKRAEERIPLLLETPAAVRWISAEPLLGPINLETWLRSRPPRYLSKEINHKLGWVVCGGESGPGYRPMDPDWARSIRDQCRVAGVPFFMKQMAGKKEIPEDLMVREWPYA